MEVTCPNCEMSFAENSMESRFGLLVCSNCDHRFKPKLSGNTSLPSIYTVANEGSDLVIRKKWYRKENIIVTGFMTFMASVFMILGGGLLFSSGHDFVTKLAVLPFFVCFIVPGYSLILSLYSITEIRAGTFGVVVTYKTPLPVPFLKKISLPLSSIQQIYCEQKITYSGSRRGVRKTTFNYNINAVLKNGATAKIDNVETAEEGRAVEGMIEKHLGIWDEAVPQEFNW